jgi:hypothetical protein
MGHWPCPEDVRTTAQPGIAQFVDKIGCAQAAQQQVGRPRQPTGSRYRRAKRLNNLFNRHR